MLKIKEIMYFFCLKSIVEYLRRQIYDKICDFSLTPDFFCKNILMVEIYTSDGMMGCLLNSMRKYFFRINHSYPSQRINTP